MLLNLATAVAACTAGFVQPSMVHISARDMKSSSRAASFMSADAPSTRRAIMGAAAALMLPGVAHAELSDERKAAIMAEERAKMETKAVASEDDEKKSKVAVTLISGIVLVAPILGITGAQQAIKSMVADDEELQDQLRGNDPTTKFQRTRKF